MVYTIPKPESFGNVWWDSLTISTARAVVATNFAQYMSIWASNNRKDPHKNLPFQNHPKNFWGMKKKHLEIEQGLHKYPDHTLST